ncbi:MAG TPA: hypothetical protein VE643_09890 [Nitrososphaeraceae archaeon]|nr:hypothetical protein [Nitrososphaeraceae archaeon]
MKGVYEINNNDNDNNTAIYYKPATTSRVLTAIIKKSKSSKKSYPNIIRSLPKSEQKGFTRICYCNFLEAEDTMKSKPHRKQDL